MAERKPLVVLKQPPAVGDSPEVRNARKLLYFVVLAQEAKVDPNKVRPDELIYRMASPYERRGYTSRDIETWIGTCDPVKKPPWNEVACFRAKARAALKPRLGLAVPLVFIGGAAFLGAFLFSSPKR